MIDNAIDLHDTVRESVVFVRRAVAAESLRLSGDDVRAVEEASRSIERELARVDDELVRLKRFYTQ
jgi:hypothetical protein